MTHYQAAVITSAFNGLIPGGFFAHYFEPENVDEFLDIVDRGVYDHQPILSSLLLGEPVEQQEIRAVSSELVEEIQKTRRSESTTPFHDLCKSIQV